MELGNFSISLSVKDIHVSKAFYEKLGFKQIHGVIEQNWVIMQNGKSVIGLFQRMFTGNVLTFNPGWDENGHNLDPFDDVRDIQAHLINEGISLVKKADEQSEGPEHITLIDPDGNKILIDQHR